MLARPAQVRKSHRIHLVSRKHEYTTTNSRSTKNLRIWGRPSRGCGEKARASRVPRIKSASWSLMGGSRSFSPERSRATSARARNHCEKAIPKRIETADAKVNHRAARAICDSGGFIEAD